MITIPVGIQYHKTAKVLGAEISKMLHYQLLAVKTTALNAKQL